LALFALGFALVSFGLIGAGLASGDFSAAFFAAGTGVVGGLAFSGGFVTTGGSDGSTTSTGWILKPTAYETKNVSITSSVDMKIPFAFTN
jgi:hypothetical protein